MSQRVTRYAPSRRSGARQVRPEALGNRRVGPPPPTRPVGADAIARSEAWVGQDISFVRCSEPWQHQPVKTRHGRIPWAAVVTAAPGYDPHVLGAVCQATGDVRRYLELVLIGWAVVGSASLIGWRGMRVQRGFQSVQNL